MSKFKAPFSKGSNKNGHLQTSQQGLPPLKIGKNQILTPGTKKKILKRLAHNIKEKDGKAVPVSPDISLSQSVQFDSQSDSTSTANPSRGQSQNVDDEMQSGEEFDLELSPRNDIRNHQNENEVKLPENIKSADETIESLEVNVIEAKEGEVQNQLKQETSNLVKSSNSETQQKDQNCSMEKNPESRMSMEEPQVYSYSIYLDLKQKSEQKDILVEDGEYQNKKERTKVTFKAKQMKPKFKKKTKKLSPDISQNTVKQRSKKETRSKKMKETSVTTEVKTMGEKNKQVKLKDRKRLKIKNFKSVPFEALNFDNINKQRRSKKSTKRNKSKKELKEDVMRMIQKMHREIEQLLDKRNSLLKDQERTDIPYPETIATEE